MTRRREPTPFAALIRQERIALGIGQAALSREAGLGSTYVRDLERGISRNQKQHELAQFLKVFNRRLREAGRPEIVPPTGPEPQLPENLPKQSEMRDAAAAPATARRLTVIRQALAEDASSFARRIGVHPNMLARLESGDLPLTIDMLRLLHDRGGVSADWVLFGDYAALSARVVQKIIDLRLESDVGRDLVEMLPDPKGPNSESVHEAQTRFVRTVQPPRE